MPDGSNNWPVASSSAALSELTGWFVLVPLAVGSLASGTLLALGTRWGLFRHYWVIFAFVLTLVATVVLVLHMPSVSDRHGGALRGACGPADARRRSAAPDRGVGAAAHGPLPQRRQTPRVTPYGWRAQRGRVRSG